MIPLISSFHYHINTLFDSSATTINAIHLMPSSFISFTKMWVVLKLSVHYQHLLFLSLVGPKLERDEFRSSQNLLICFNRILFHQYCVEVGILLSVSSFFYFSLFAYVFQKHRYYSTFKSRVTHFSNFLKNWNLSLTRIEHVKFIATESVVIYFHKSYNPKKGVSIALDGKVTHLICYKHINIIIWMNDI